MSDLSVTHPVQVIPAATADDGVALLRYREAYQKALPVAQALDLNDLITINIDVPAAVTTALGALPEIMALHEQAKALPSFDVKQIDDLGTYARAAMHAHGEYVAASAPPEALEALNAEGLALRDTLYQDALALSHRGLVNGTPLTEFKKNTGYKNLATDLIGLSSLLRNHWSQIGTRTAITPKELDHADDLSEKLLLAVGAREQAPAVIAEVAQLRQRLFTVFVNAYDEARRAISFLRWKENDIEKIAPSLYAGRTTRRAKTETAPEPGASVTPAANPLAPSATVPVTGAVPASPAASSPLPSLPGLPGSSPFAGGN